MKENEPAVSKKCGKPAVKKQEEIKEEVWQESGIDQEKLENRPFVDKNQLAVIKQALGWNENNPLRYPDKTPRNAEVKPVLYSYRNRFFTDNCASLDDLVEKSLMEYIDCNVNGISHKGYKVTEAGIEYLAKVENIDIKTKYARGRENLRSKRLKEK